MLYKNITIHDGLCWSMIKIVSVAAWMNEWSNQSIYLFPQENPNAFDREKCYGVFRTFTPVILRKNTVMLY